MIRGIENSCFCPFHPDDQGGHKSAAIRDEYNFLICYSENKRFEPYDVITKLLHKKIEDYLDFDTIQKFEEPKERKVNIPEGFYSDLRTGNKSLDDLCEFLRNRPNEGT